MSAEHLPLFDDVDVIQVGARNMQNFELLKVLEKIDKPILLKRGLANTLDELLMSASTSWQVEMKRSSSVSAGPYFRDFLQKYARYLRCPDVKEENSPSGRHRPRAMQPGSVSWSSRSLWQRSQPELTVS